MNKIGFMDIMICNLWFTSIEGDLNLTLKESMLVTPYLNIQMTKTTIYIVNKDSERLSEGWTLWRVQEIK